MDGSTEALLAEHPQLRFYKVAQVGSGALYILHAIRIYEEEIVDAVQILSVEKTDLDSSAPVRAILDNLHLSSECSSQLRLSSSNIWVDLLGSRLSGRLL